MMVSWDLARAARTRFNLRFARETKVKRFQGINDEDAFENAESQTGLKGKALSKKGKNYEVNGASERNTNTFDARTVAWKRTLTTERRQEKTRQEVAYSCSVTHGEKEGGSDWSESYQKWNTKTGKEIKSESTEPVFSELFDSCQSAFVTELAPPTPASIYGRQSSGQSCHPAIVLEKAKDSGVHTNHVALNVGAGNAWEETRTRTSIKSTLMGFLSRFKRQEKTKVKKVRL